MTRQNQNLVRIAALAGVAIVGFVLLRQPGSEDSAPSPAARPEAAAQGPAGPGPYRTEAGIGVGFARTADGARAAARSYVMSGQALLDVAPTQVPEVVAVFTTEAAGDRLADQLGAELDALRSVLADGRGRTRYVQAVLATRAEAIDDATATVTVWSVGVLWREGAAEPQAGWTTSTLSLVWERDTWLLDDETVTSGPAPAPNAAAPVTGGEIESFLEGFATGADA